MSYSWKFIMSAQADGRAPSWHWVQCQSGRCSSRSAADFLTFVGCVTDARLCGFGTADPFDVIRERRKTPRDTPRHPRTAACPVMERHG